MLSARPVLCLKAVDHRWRYWSWSLDVWLRSWSRRVVLCQQDCGFVEVARCYCFILNFLHADCGFWVIYDRLYLLWRVAQSRIKLFSFYFCNVCINVPAVLFSDLVCNVLTLALELVVLVLPWTGATCMHGLDSISAPFFGKLTTTLFVRFLNFDKSSWLFL